MMTIDEVIAELESDASSLPSIQQAESVVNSLGGNVDAFRSMNHQARIGTYDREYATAYMAKMQLYISALLARKLAQ